MPHPPQDSDPSKGQNSDRDTSKEKHFGEALFLRAVTFINREKINMPFLNHCHALEPLGEALFLRAVTFYQAEAYKEGPCIEFTSVEPLPCSFSMIKRPPTI